ncbi:MAG: PD40 domain-containing protein [Fimbriimonadaceae bacterium]|nr:PD40 domain-containing protein [Fimbriimonadaceae bacterium]
MRWLPLVVLLALPLTAAERPAACGGAFNATAGYALTAAQPAFSNRPLTVELWVKLTSAQQYNILIANEAKSSATHWELFTTPGDGLLQVYLPGHQPDHARSSCRLTDQQWHFVAAQLEPQRARLWVDGTLVADQAHSPARGPGEPGALAVGGLVSGELGCSGELDEVRLSTGARPPVVPAAELPLDATTVALWRFNEPGVKTYLAAGPRPLSLTCQPSGRVVSGTQTIPGGMPTALQPLPAAEPVEPWRTALQQTAAAIGLRLVGSPRDAVLRSWSSEYTGWNRRDYPESRPGSVDPAKLRAQAFDPQALVWERDGGPLGTALRRAAALAAGLRARGVDPPGAAADLAALQAAAGQAARDSAAERGLFVATCAVRRTLALADPLLAFDDLLCVARGSFAGSVRSNPVNQDYQGGHFVTQYFGFNALPGGGLYLVRNWRRDPQVVNLLANSVVENGRFAGRKLDFGAFTTPDLDFDGRRIVFAWSPNRQHQWTYSRDTCWHLFCVNADGTALRQLTDGAYNDFDPCWLPDGRIAFVSERRGGHIRCFAATLKVRNYTLFGCAADGSDLRPLSYYETSEWNPNVTADGRLVYTRWDYTDRENCLGSRAWFAGPDGTDPRAPHGNYPLPYDTFVGHAVWGRGPDGRELDSRFGAPLVEMGLRQIPGSHRFLFTAAPHHGEIYGSLAMLDLQRPDDGHLGQIQRVTPDELFPETELPGRRHYKYGTPWPLSEEVYLSNRWEDLVRVDRWGNQELLLSLRELPGTPDERLRLSDPIPLRPRTRPPVIPSRIRRDGSPATVAVINVNDADLPLPANRPIKWLRVTQNILKFNHAMGEPLIGYERENTPRIPLGIVPVEADGSVYFEAPPAKELIFQVLDEHYMAVQSMRSTAFLQPGEQLTCRGCHERPQSAPRGRGTPLALRRGPSRLQPELGAVEPISYERQIEPILLQRCLPCHQEHRAGPVDLSYAALKEGYTFWFSGAMFGQMTTDYSGVHGGSRTIPGRFGAHASKIGQALLDVTHRGVVSPADRRALILWLDSNSLRLGAFTRVEAQERGELVWPELDVDPANPRGERDTGPGLAGNFWHENQQGPYRVLLSSHTADKVLIRERDGRISWEYSIRHPQDCWLLPNGNVLVAWTHGVREVTMAKETVWEYTTGPPNEIPNCQPLPNGNVLIGIVGECRLIEVNRAKEIVRQVKLSTPVANPHEQFRFCRATGEGTYLVPFTAEGVVREVDATGQVLHSYACPPRPVSAWREPDGHTLLTASHSILDYDRHGRVVWELTANDVPDLNLSFLAGCQRLPHGNLLVCNWNARDGGGKIGAHLFEVTPDKRVVWQVAGTPFGQVAQVQVLPDSRPQATNPLQSH